MMHSTTRLAERRLSALGAVCLCLGLLLSGTAYGQPADVQRNSPKVLKAFTEVVAKASQSTVQVQCDGKDVALGTIVAKDGWILTKASELKSGKLVCKCKDGREFSAEVVGTDEKYDLALLKAGVKDLTPVEWADSKPERPGRWVASPGIGSEPVEVGVISVGTRDITGKGAAPGPNPNSGFLGVGLDLDFAGVKVASITPRSGASDAGLKANDQILSVNGEKVEHADDFMAILQRSKPGDQITLKVLRDDKEQEIKAKLGKRPGNERGDIQNSMGSKLSDRRTGFPVILQHDSILKPAECGGPLVDLDGKVIGVNIARAGRVESYAIPSEEIRKLLPKLKEGKSAPVEKKP